jgi:hypothetical protein
LDRTIFTLGHDEKALAIEIENRCFVIAIMTSGGIGGYKTQSNCDTTNLTSDYWIIKFCDTTSTTNVSNIQPPTSNFLIFPNPVTNQLTVITNINAQSEIIIFDITSRKLLQQQFTNSITLNTALLAKGIYLYEVRNKNGVVKKGKVVKE